MTYLIACLGSGKGTWFHLNKLTDSDIFEHVFLVTNQFGKENFKPDNKTTLIVVDFNKPIELLIEDIRKYFENKIHDTEVAVNLISGTGKEHMAIISALLKLGLGIRLVDVTEQGVKEI